MSLTFALPTGSRTVMESSSNAAALPDELAMGAGDLPRGRWWSLPLSLWGLGGVVALLGSAIWRLTPIAVEALADGLTAVQWVVTVLWVAFMAWSEGYRGFHTRFSPRTAARALYLGRRSTPLRVMLGPLFCMGYFGATRRVRITAWAITTMVVCLVLLVRLLDQPWRGIVDLGVVVGLAWGLASLLYFFAVGLARRRLPVDPAVPGATPAVSRARPGGAGTDGPGSAG